MVNCRHGTTLTRSGIVVGSEDNVLRWFEFARITGLVDDEVDRGRKSNDGEEYQSTIDEVSFLPQR